MHTQSNVHGGAYPRPSLSNGQSHGAMPMGFTAHDFGAEGFVLVAMALVTLAVGSALHLHAGLGFMASLACALITYLAILSGHAFVHHTSAARVANVSKRGRPVAPDHAMEGEFASAANDVRDNRAAAPFSVHFSQAAVHANPGIPSAVASSSDAASAPPLPRASADIVKTAPAMPLSVSPPADGRAGVANPVVRSRPPREADVDMVEALIKKLADEVNSAGDISSQNASSGTSAGPTTVAATGRNAGAPIKDNANRSKGVSIAAMGPARTDVADQDDAKPRGPVSIASQKKAVEPIVQDAAPTGAISAPAEDDGSAQPGVNDGSVGPIEVSVDALRATADTMRDHSSEAAPQLPPALPDVAGDDATDAAADTDDAQQQHDPAAFAIICDALDAGRVDVLLDPILGLDNRRARHFEISLRLRDIDNSVVDTQEYCERLAGSGLSTLLDRAALSRTATVAFQLEERGRNGAVFSKVQGESIGAEAFVNDVFEAFNQRSALSGQLVMTLSQAHARELGQREWDTLRDLKNLGFRFALSSVTDLDMDFEDLAEKGFCFVKLDADVFLNGMPTGDTIVPAKDICGHLANMGHTVVVERINDEAMMTKVSGFGAMFGQGTLFGGPRAVKADALKANPGSAAA